MDLHSVRAIAHEFQCQYNNDPMNVLEKDCREFYSPADPSFVSSEVVEGSSKSCASGTWKSDANSQGTTSQRAPQDTLNALGLIWEVVIFILEVLAA